MIHVERITHIRQWDNDAAKRLDERNKGVIFKNCVKCEIYRCCNANV